MASADPMAAVHQYINDFNKGDGDALAAIFAFPGLILEGMAPHVWQRPTATQDWYLDVLIEGKQHGAADYFVTLGKPLHKNGRSHTCVPANTAGSPYRRIEDLSRRCVRILAVLTGIRLADLCVSVREDDMIDLS